MNVQTSSHLSPNGSQPVLNEESEWMALQNAFLNALESDDQRQRELIEQNHKVQAAFQAYRLESEKRLQALKEENSQLKQSLISLSSQQAQQFTLFAAKKRQLQDKDHSRVESACNILTLMEKEKTEIEARMAQIKEQQSSRVHVAPLSRYIALCFERYHQSCDEMKMSHHQLSTIDTLAKNLKDLFNDQ